MYKKNLVFFIKNAIVIKKNCSNFTLKKNRHHIYSIQIKNKLIHLYKKNIFFK